MPAVKIESEQQFKRLLESLAREIVDANIHWTLQKDLAGEIEPFTVEFNQSVTFWTLTLQAQLDAAIFRLIRIYDGNIKVLSLRNFLDTVAANLPIFDVEQYRDRLKDSPFVESLVADAQQPDPKQLEEDIAFVSNENELVRKLTIWRNNLFAHKSAQNAVDDYNLAADYPLVGEEIDQLLSQSVTILNRYSLMFVANAYSTEIVGRDDFKYVLECVRKDIAARQDALKDPG